MSHTHDAQGGWDRQCFASLFPLTYCKQVSFHGLFSSMFSTFIFYLVVNSLFKRAPRHTAEVLPTIPKSKAVLCQREKILVINKFHSDMSYSSVSSMLMNQQYILRCLQTGIYNTYNEFMYWLIAKNIVTRGSQEPNTECPPRAMAEPLLIQGTISVTCIWTGRVPEQGQPELHPTQVLSFLVNLSSFL